MFIEFIRSNEIMQNIIQIFILMNVIRTVFVLGILFAVITAKVVFFNKPLLDTDHTNQTSPTNTFEVIFSQFFGIKTKPFLLNKVY